ncbi:hypothetical protein [Hydrogenophaga sp.]|uniref:hypothetical protein n=1 Tax=Hydrogenophaga sp. TaxID=1904254 RepID=UPI00271ED59E|nr:hypothetical protein [Hydrogenophaga sp.]MDO8903635.1 hypothetical protein [Hydrogenophaga sp.]
MLALKKTRKLIESDPNQASAVILSSLVVSLESDKPFQLADLYQLNYDDFKLALDLLAEWRLDRYYSSKVRLLDVSVNINQLRDSAEAARTA